LAAEYIFEENYWVRQSVISNYNLLIDALRSLYIYMLVVVFYMEELFCAYHLH